MWSEKAIDKSLPRPCDPNDAIELGDNSDSDLVIAFARGSKTHVVLLEAKGYTRWDTKQLKHKLDRLTKMFGVDGKRFAAVVPYWVFVSPGPPPNLEWPQWMLDPQSGDIRHLRLPQPASHKYAVARCDSEGRRVDGGILDDSR